MKLLLKLRADCQQSNLPTIKKVAIIILDKYNQSKFQDIVLAYYYSENNNSNQYYFISSNLAAYMFFHYVLFFSNGNPR